MGNTRDSSGRISKRGRTIGRLERFRKFNHPTGNPRETSRKIRHITARKTVRNRTIKQPGKANLSDRNTRKTNERISNIS